MKKDRKKTFISFMKIAMNLLIIIQYLRATPKSLKQPIVYRL